MKLSDARKQIEKVGAEITEVVRIKGGLRINTIRHGKKRTTMKTMKIGKDELG